MRTFEHPNFPKGVVCPICNKADDKECMLIAIAGTQKGSNCEAVIVHTDCVEQGLVYYKEQGLIAIKTQ